MINVDLKKDKLKIKNKNYKYTKGNICNYNFLNKIINNRIDCIVNFAAQTHVDRSIDFPNDFEKFETDWLDEDDFLLDFKDIIKIIDNAEGEA